MAAYADVAAISVRGQFLHRALELAWGMLPDQDALHAAMAEARVEPLLEQAVAQAADETLTDYAPRSRRWNASARRVLANWLDLEARRLPFSVAQVEKDQQWQRGALMLAAAGPHRRAGRRPQGHRRL